MMLDPTAVVKKRADQDAAEEETKTLVAEITDGAAEVTE